MKGRKVHVVFHASFHGIHACWSSGWTTCDERVKRRDESGSLTVCVLFRLAAAAADATGCFTL